MKLGDLQRACRRQIRRKFWVENLKGWYHWRFRRWKRDVGEVDLWAREAMDWMRVIKMTFSGVPCQHSNETLCKKLGLSWWAVKFWRESMHRICTGRNNNYIFMLKVMYQKRCFALFSCRPATEENRTGHGSVVCIPACTGRGLLMYRMLELAFWPSMFVCWCGGFGGRL